MLSNCYCYMFSNIVHTSDIKMSVIYFILLIMLHCRYGISHNPGVRAYFSKTAINDLLGVVVNGFASDVVKQHIFKIPDQKGTENIGIVPCKWHIKNTNITGVQKPYSKVTLEDGALRWRFTQASLELEADWGVHVPLGQSSGRLTLRICLNADVKLSFYKMDFGRVVSCNTPTVCGSEIDIHDHHKYPDLVQTVINALANKYIAEELRNLVCKGVTDRFKRDPPVRLYHFNETTLMTGYHISFLMKPSDTILIDKKGIFGNISGEIRAAGVDYLYDANPMVSPAISKPYYKTHKMIQCVASSYVISTMIYTASRKGLLNGTIIGSKVRPEDGIYLATTCRGTCIGKDIPQLSKRYPDQFLNVHLRPTDAITVDIREKDVVADVGHQGEFYINGTTLFSIFFCAQVTFVPYHVENTVTLKGNVSIIKVSDVNLLNSTVGHLPNDVLETLAGLVRKVYIVSRVNGIFALPFDLTLIASKDGTKESNMVSMKNMDLKLRENMVVLSADIAIKIWH